MPPHTIGAASERTQKPTTLSWSIVHQNGDMPLHGCCQSLANYKDETLILFGGGALHFIFNDVHCFDIKTSTWTRKETINSEVVAPRISHSAVVHGDNMYVYGGQDLFMPTRFADVLVLNLITFEWSVLEECVPSEPDGPGERRLHTAHMYGNRMYVLMGEPCNTTHNFWYLDLDTHRWHTVQSHGYFGKPILPLLGHSAQMEGDYLYVFGGYHAYAAAHGGSLFYSNSLFCYHFPTNTWCEVQTGGGPRPSPRYSCAMAVLGGRVYIYGGDTDGEVYYDDFWYLDVGPFIASFVAQSSSTRLDTSVVTAHVPSPTWIDLTLSCGKARPSARSGHASAVAQGYLFIVGGELPGDKDVVYYSNRTYRYPLGLFTRLPLTELALRWLGCCSPGNLLLRHGQISRPVREQLRRNILMQESEKKEDLMPCTRVT
ncbi:kelch domain [Trypanosoma vivax]|uniref:Kelch domain-containing protein n=1 Tax=Trypanosoma vivax (strain Y486) TaxID=1055687 RepID=G0TR10_TRYVY|nr:hypothetical protein TRVL_01239 [Trypanosoma vivax]KAH8611118.1 kelch domain [Trypanosoma vivax]CCC46374.1 conserved hypothetical protein [Trypanosoma vivax Y486]